MAGLPITIDEVEARRDPAGLLKWCVEKIEEIAAVDGGTHAIRFGEGLCKVLTEEVYPLAQWATTTPSLSPNALITPQVGSQPFDAVVESAGFEPSTFFAEVTQAHMGQSEYFRMLHLEQEGWAPGPLSGVERVGGRDSRTIRPGRVIGSVNGHISKTKSLVLRALQKKVGKAYERPTVLIVAFEDFIIKNDDTAFDQLAEHVAAYLAEVSHPFLRVYLVGTGGFLSGCVYDEG